MADIPGGPTPPPPPPPPGTPQGPGSLRPRGLGEILSAAFDIYRNNAAPLLLIVAVVVVPVSFIGALLGQAFEPTESTVDVGGVPVESRSFFIALLAALVLVAIGIIIWAVSEAAILRGAAQATIGDPVDIEASYRWGLRRFGSVLLIALLVGLAVAIGFLLLIIPGIILLVFLSVTIPALVVENRRGTDAMKRSWNLVSGNFWHALVVILVAAIITGIVGGLIGAIGGSNWFLRWIFQAIAQIITVPFTALVTVVLYVDLRARREALTADTLRAELASNV
jgi:hypothetical protein